MALSKSKVWLLYRAQTEIFEIPIALQSSSLSASVILTLFLKMFGGSEELNHY